MTNIRHRLGEGYLFDMLRFCVFDNLAAGHSAGARSGKPIIQPGKKSLISSIE